MIIIQSILNWGVGVVNILKRDAYSLNYLVIWRVKYKVFSIRNRKLHSLLYIISVIKRCHKVPGLNLQTKFQKTKLTVEAYL